MDALTRHPRRRLVQAIGVAAVAHVLALVLFGSFVVYEFLLNDEAAFEAPPPTVKNEPPPPPVEIKLSQEQKESARPVRRLEVTNIAEINVPQIEVTAPNVDSRVAVGTGGGTGFGSGLGSGNLNLYLSEIDFFGIKGKGERVVFLIDTGRYMLLDDKGGLYAYRIVKEEIIEQISRLKPGTLFNVILFGKWGRNLNVFAPQLVTANEENKEKLAVWLRPINENANRIGTQGSNYQLATPLEPIGPHLHGAYRAIHAAMEMKTDAVFVLAGDWSVSLRKPRPPGFDEQAWRVEQGWTPQKQADWDAAVARAQKWLAEENRKRTARGMAPKVVQNNHELVRETGDTTPSPPYFNPGDWTSDEIFAHFKELASTYYNARTPKGREKPPSVNVIVFRGKDEGWPDRNDEVVQDFVQRNRGVRKVLEGLAAIENVTGRPARVETAQN